MIKISEMSPRFRTVSSPTATHGFSLFDSENVSGARTKFTMTTQAFSSAMVGKCSQNSRTLKFVPTENTTINYGIAPAQVMNSSHDSKRILPIMRTADKSSSEI